MKITFVLPPAGMAGGIRVVAIYAEHLIRRGHEVCAVSVPWPKLSFKQCMRSWLRGDGWPTWRNGMSSHLDDVPQLRHDVIDSVRTIVDGDVPDGDVVIATWWETAPWVAALSPSKGSKHYLIQHDERVIYPEGDQRRRQVSDTWLLPLHKIVIARWLVEVLREAGVEKPIGLVPNAVDLDLFQSPPRGKQPTTTVGTLYSPDHFKGTDLTLAAIRLAAAEVPGLKLRCFSMMEEAPNLKLPEGAELSVQPPQARIAEIYGTCDAWLFSSRCEGFGLPILEAMACRTPVIGTPAGAAPELIAAGGGILVEPESPESIARAIVTIAKMNDSEWESLSAKALSTAQSYTWAQAVDRLEDWFESAANPQADDPRRDHVHDNTLVNHRAREPYLVSSVVS